MNTDFVSPEELTRTFDVVDEISRGDSFFVAVVQKGQSSDSIQVCQTGIGEWIDIPLRMIASAKIVGIASAEGKTYQVALIKLNEPTDSFAKVAYRLLSQLGTIQQETSASGRCECHGKSNESESRSPAYSSARLSAPTSLSGGLGRFGIGGKCRFVLRCYSCTRCIPWTNVCWSSTCCDLVTIDCTIGV